MYSFGGGIREVNLHLSAAGIVKSISCWSNISDCINPYFNLLQKPVEFVNVDSKGKGGLRAEWNGD